MSCRLPGGIDSPQQLWDFLLSKGDARSRVPPSRYKIDAFYSGADQPGTIKTQYGYFLDSDIASFDSSLFSMSPMELARCDPQQRLLLEVARECIEDAGETDWKGRRIGVYVGNFGEDWNEMLDYDDQQYGVYRLAGSGDFALSNRVSYEMDLQGPSMTIRTACSSSLVSLHEACLALARGDCESAIVAGTSLILTPSMTVKLSEQGLAGISDASETAFVECHGTGTLVGDPVETNAVARVFGNQRQTYIGSVKPNLGHSEGASGLTSVIKVVLALEHRTIPPNIKLGIPNPKIPFESARLTVPLEPTPWPSSVDVERASVNSFGIGGNNCHVILESAASHGAAPTLEESSDTPQLLVYSAGSPESLRKSIDNHAAYLSRHPERIEDLAFTLANRRQHLPYRGFVVSSREKPGIPSQSTQKLSSSTGAPTVIMVFTGQGAQWPQMGRALMRSNPTFRTTIQSLDQHLKSLGETSPDWTIEAELRKPAKRSRLDTAELSQPLCTALQIALVDSLACIGVVPDAVVGHSSGEIAAAYAAGALTAQEAITAAFHRGVVANKQSRSGAMAAIGMGWAKVKPFLIPGADVACENSPRSVTISGDADKVEAVVAAIQAAHPDVLARLLKVDKAYHSYHMTEVGDEYHRLVGPNVPGRSPTKPFFSSVTGDLLVVQEVLDAKYWQRNLESPVLFSSAISRITEHPVGKNALFLEVGPHSALAGPVRQILTERMYPILPGVNAWNVSNTPHPAKRAVAIGYLICMGNVGGLIGSFIYKEDEAPRYVTGYGNSFAFAAAGIVACLVLEIALFRSNRRKERVNEEEVRERYTDSELEEMEERSPLFRYTL
ncbi:acyl transferase domain-containing protein [Aspergillus navahoensis]